ncbi:MAG: Lrp/AsnC family transcriptional regulator [Pseudomonadota bacterium]
MDKIDRRMLQALKANGRLTVQELSAQVGLSPSPCSRRLKALEEEGYIQGYCALIDERRVGFGVSVFVSVQLDRQVDDALEAFETAVSGYPEVVDCWLMTGNRDYLLRIATEDMADFERFLTHSLTKIPGVATIESSIPLRRVKFDICRAPAV